VCGPLKNGAIVDIRQSTIGDILSGGGLKKEALGKRSVNKGRVTFTLTNMDWNDFPWPTNDIAVTFFMAESADNQETNWHVLGNRFEETGRVQTKMVSQRFDGICVPDTRLIFCEKKWTDYDMPMYDYSRVYKFDCSWNTITSSMIAKFGGGDGVVDGLAKCDIIDVTDPKAPSPIATYMVPTSGPYHHLNWFAAGGASGSLVEKPNLPTTLTDFRFTLFQD
jgi:hypothetical protein